MQTAQFEYEEDQDGFKAPLYAQRALRIFVRHFPTHLTSSPPPILVQRRLECPFDVREEEWSYSVDTEAVGRPTGCRGV